MSNHYVLYSQTLNTGVYRKKKTPDRLFVRDYPNPGDGNCFLAKFRSLFEAVEARDLVGDFSFDVYEWKNNQLGEKVDV